MFAQLYIGSRFYAGLAGVILLFVTGTFSLWIFTLALIVLLIFGILVIIDGWLLFRSDDTKIHIRREVADHLSNGDENPVTISVQSEYLFDLKALIIDECPVQFQMRKTHWDTSLSPHIPVHLRYTLRPVERGEYVFGAVHVFIRSPIALLMRRHTDDRGRIVKVYPSYLQMRKYAFLALDQRLQLAGTKRMRRLGHTSEFEQIKEYVGGDDSRTINWKATARTGHPMVNQYRDERAQPVYNVIDKGRLMQMPFNGMTLLDYAINASLVMSYIAIRKEDNAGLLTFADRPDTFVSAGRRKNQMYRLSEALYNQSTVFPEADFERLYVTISRRFTQRSLLLLYTNFESLSGLRRQLPYLQRIARRHVVVVIFFKNTEIADFVNRQARSLREVYHQTIAARSLDEKEGMELLLRQHGLYGVLTTPQELTVDTINAYLKLKARGVI
jgi:uncharacterized protein (DUF58 family)